MAPPVDDATLVEFEKAADLRFQLDVEELYEAPIKEAKKLGRLYSNAGIAEAPYYSDKTADAVIDAFKSMANIVEQDYIEGPLQYSGRDHFCTRRMVATQSGKSG